MSEQHETCESQLFTWNGWDQNDTASFMFYEAVLVAPIGQFKVGDKFDFINMNYDKATMELSRNDEVWIFKLNLNVGPLLHHQGLEEIICRM
jgi:hypothetical protein